MDAEQESRWAAAQGIGIGEDLIPAALRHLDFLAAVDRRRWLYEGPLLDRAIRRYRRLPGFSTTQRGVCLRVEISFITPSSSVGGWLGKKPYPTL